MSVQGKAGELFINGKKIAADVTFEFNLEPPHPEKVRIKHHRTREDAEKYHSKGGFCLVWCNCRRMLCSGLSGHGSPFHFYPAHDCAETVAAQKELGLMDEVE